MHTKPTHQGSVHWRRLGLTALLGAVALRGANIAAATTASGNFPLRVNDVSGLDEPWPLIGGLPFPEGALHDGAQIRITDATGTEVSAQVDVVATWRDGSIRWAQAGFSASPQGEYRVEYGPGVSRRAPAQPLLVEQTAELLTVDTGAAVYTFLPDRLLPETARMGDTVFLDNAGDGAYLIDNQGRLARVAGAAADIQTQVLKQGPTRVVIHREGWYVTGDGARIARARVWFYLSVGTPALRVTHSLIFTDDTNALWVRDYGLAFNTPDAPASVRFALGDPAQPPRVMTPVGVGSLLEIDPAGDDVYMLQETYPHYRDTDARARVARTPADNGAPPQSHALLAETPTLSDWADGTFPGYGLTLVMPWLAQRFPKAIAFGPQGARAAFWSGDSGRELDFRAATLVAEYFKEWAEYSPLGERGPDAAAKLAAQPSNAQCAARTHDLWLLPRVGAVDEPTLRARAAAAAHPPLLRVDPAWSCATEAIGWPMHPRDALRFPREEEVIDDLWRENLMSHYENQRLNGFIAWGSNPFIRTVGATHFRVNDLIDYGLRRNVWGLFVRGGERSLYDYATRFNRFAGDWNIAHWTAGNKFAGGFAWGDVNTPFYWGHRGDLRTSFGITGHTILNLLLEYYLTGDEWAHDLTHQVGEAFRERFDFQSAPRYDGASSTLGVINTLYQREWDEDFADMARHYANWLIDLEIPPGINDNVPYGVYYKMGRIMLALYDYYRLTGDERARTAFLKGAEDKYRFQRYRGAFSGQSYSSFIFSVAYEWTGHPGYLGVLNRLLEQHRTEGPDPRPSQITAHIQKNPFFGVPISLAVMAGLESPVAPFPVLETATYRPIYFRKAADAQVDVRVYLRMSGTLHEDTPPSVLIRPYAQDPPGLPLEDVQVDAEQMFRTRNESRQDPRCWHLRMTIPAHAPDGEYGIEFGGAETIRVLESNALEMSLDPAGPGT